MNAANFFSGRDALKRNQFGARFGGPVVIPKVYNGKDQTFHLLLLSGHAQADRRRRASLRTAPSQAMKEGDLSAFLRAERHRRHPRSALAGPVFSRTIRFRSAASILFPRRLLQLIPASSDPQLSVALRHSIQRDRRYQWMLRGDHSSPANSGLRHATFYLHFDRPWVLSRRNLLYVNAGQFGSAHNATFAHTYSISPRLAE